MFEAFVITLREGVESALVLAIATSLLRRRGLDRLIPPLLAGAALAVLASAGLAVLVMRIPYNEELAEGVGMLVAAALVLGLVVWMWRAAPRLRQEIDEGLGRAAGDGAAGGAAGVFLFGLAMVLREGFETAVFLSAASFDSAGLQLWTGAIVGLIVAATFGVLFARGALRVPLKPFFQLTSAVLLLFAFRLLVGGLHELSEAELLPASRAEMALVGPLVKNELLLFTLTVALASGWLLLGAGPAPSPDAHGADAAARLARAAAMRERSRRRWTGLVGVVVVAALAVGFVQTSRVPGRPAAQPLAVAAGDVRFATAALDDGALHFYEVALPGARSVRFFAIRVGDDVRTCFDACEICGDFGYVPRAGAAVCRNCTSPIPLATLGRSGGCNPIPLTHATDGGMLVVREADLRAGLPKLEGR